MTENTTMSIWASNESMQTAVRMAEYLAKAKIIPQQYQSNPGDCLIAIDLSNRMGVSPVTIMQNTQVIYGTLTWKGSACKALIDGCGKYRNSRYEFKGTPGKDDWGCRLVAEDIRTKLTVTGPWVDIAMAKKDGWYSKKDRNGNETSKWQSIPELMMRYRAASFFAKTECPEALMGFTTAEEVQDAQPTKPDYSSLEKLTDTVEIAEEIPAAMEPAALPAAQEPVEVPVFPKNGKQMSLRALARQ